AAAAAAPGVHAGAPLFVADVRIDALAARATVGAVADDVVRAVVARHAVLEVRVPGVVEVTRLGVGPEPAAHAARRVDQLRQRARQRAGVHLELVDLLGQGLHLGLRQADLGAVAAAHDARGREGDDAAHE